MLFEFSKFVDKALVELTLNPPEVDFLRRLSYSSGTYSELAEIIKKNPTVERQLVEIGSILLNQDDESETITSEFALEKMGPVLARNYLVASMVKRSSTLLTSESIVKKTLKFALETENAGTELASTYFTAGLVYDLLINALVKSDSDLSPPVLVQNTWKHSLQVCTVARQLANRLCPNLKCEKEICLHALLHDIGKVALYLLEPEKEENSSFPEKHWARDLKGNGLSHDCISHFVLWTVGFLPESSWIALYHHQPYLASRSGKDSHQQATLIWLADQICRYREFHQVSRFADKMVKGWFNATQTVLPEIGPFLKFMGVLKSLVF